MKEKIGIVKEVDMLGRIVIPKEFRKRFGFCDRVEIIPTEEGILVRSPEYRLVKIEKTEKESKIKNNVRTDGWENIKS